MRQESFWYVLIATDYRVCEKERSSWRSYNFTTIFSQDFNGFPNVTDAQALVPEELQQFGSNLVHNFYQDIYNSSVFADMKEQLLSPAFQLVRLNGARFTKENYVPFSFQNASIEDIKATAPSPDTVVVRFNSSLVGGRSYNSSDSSTFSSEKSPYLHVYQRNTNGAWQVASISNLAPVMSDCNKPSQPSTPTSPKTKDDELATTLIKDFISHWENGTAMQYLSPQIQIQFPNGMGGSGLGTAAQTTADKYQYDNVVGRRNEDLLVVTYDAVISGLNVSSVMFDNTTAPRMTVFWDDPATDTWKVIAYADFSNPSGSKKACIAPGPDSTINAVPAPVPASGVLSPSFEMSVFSLPVCLLLSATLFP